MDGVEAVPCEGFMLGWGDLCLCSSGQSWVFSLKGSAKPSSVFLGVQVLDMASGSLSANFQGCVPVFLKVWYEAPGTGACCPLGGTWFK